MSDRTDLLRRMSREDGEDLAFLVCGKHLGGGSNRDVFVFRLDETKVIKYASSGEGYQNVIEHAVWDVVQHDKDLAMWFAPIHWLSGLHQWVIQARTQPIAPEQLPKRVPTVFTDLKAENWGWLDGRPVCHDYGSVMCRLFDSRSRRLRRADWHS